MIKHKIRLVIFISAIIFFFVLILSMEQALFIVGERNLSKPLTYLETIVPRSFLYYADVVIRWKSSRYLLSIILGLSLALLGASGSIDRTYGLKNAWLALRHVLSATLGIWLPKLEIDNGEKQKKRNLLDIVGGPGVIHIDSESAVLLECSSKPGRIITKGRFYIKKFEAVKYAVPLTDIHGYIEKASTITKDGIETSVSDIHYEYRLWNAQDSSNRLRSYQGLLKATYERSARSDGIVSWHQLIKIAVNASITDYIRSHRFDEVIAPRFEDEDPRVAIEERLFSQSMQKRLKGIGAELLWVDMGDIQAVDYRVDEQFVETWGAKWLGNAKVKKAFGEATAKSYESLGFIEAISQLILAIREAIETIGLKESNLDPGVLRVIAIYAIELLASKNKENEDDNDG
jgi:hypothetical protein